MGKSNKVPIQTEDEVFIDCATDLLSQTECLLEKLFGAEGTRDIPFFNQRLKLLTQIKALLKIDDAQGERS